MEKVFVCLTAEEMASVATAIVEALGEARVVALDAPMGAGKTTLVKAVCCALGSEDEASSPTFSIVNDYRLRGGRRLYHFDLYRLRDVREAYDMGFDEYLDSGEWCFVEWPAIAEELLPADMAIVRIAVREDGARVLTVVR